MLTVINSKKKNKIENVDRLSDGGNWCLIDEMMTIYSFFAVVCSLKK